MQDTSPGQSKDITREEYLEMDEAEFRARFRERVHHTLEIQTYSALYHDKVLRDTQTKTVEYLMALWKEKGLSTDKPDYKWGLEILGFARANQSGEKVDLSPFSPKELDGKNIQAIESVIFERRSVRHWLEKDVPDDLIDKILTAGLWAPHACNLQSIRYIVVKEQNEPGLFKGSDIPGGPVHIILLQDRRVYLANPRMPSYNRYLDCGAAAQNIVLAAHSYGLGGCWLTFRLHMIDRLKDRFNLPEYIEIVTYVDIGYPDQTPLPPYRLELLEMLLARV